MSGPYKSIPRCHFRQNPPPQGGFFYAAAHFTRRVRCGILNKLLNSQQHAALPHAHKGVTAMIRIVTDSAADLTAAELNAPGVFVVPLSVTFADGTTQLDDGTMTKDEFFARLASDSKLPRTSQPSPASFMQVYEDAAAAGDEVLVITIGQKLSGTYQCAHLAAADVGLQAHIVDSEAASQAEALLVREAVRLRDEEGLTAEEIAAVLEQFKKRVRIVAVVDSLKHLQKGGRLPAAVALVGGALGIKPVLALQDGAIKLVDKGRGRPGALVAMFKQLDALGGVDPRCGYTLLYSDNKQLIAPVHHYMHQNLHLTGGRVAQLGPTIGTHVGPGVVGVVFVAKE